MCTIIIEALNKPKGDIIDGALGSDLSRSFLFLEN